MKLLLSTSALVVALGFPNVLVAQTALAAAQQGMPMQGFLSERGESDLLASDLIGHAVHARRAMAETSGTGGQGAAASTAQNVDGTKNMQRMNRADLDQFDDIGQINDIVLSNNGQVRAIIIDVGGFLGMGARDVAVTMDQVSFSVDAEDRSKMYIVVNANAEMLQGYPAYDRMMIANDQATGRAVFAAPPMKREGYNLVEMTELSAEMLVGQSVYGVNDKSVGTIDDLIVDDKGTISNVIIDFGGFLGMGSSKISVGFDELTVLGDAGRKNVRVYIDATKEQVQAQPEYRASN
jgi:sporulation protein YlmC with PRC-barrel domain